jgi:hypothetical protein
MASKLSIYNGALRKLGEASLSALTDEGPARRALDDAYDEIVAECLEAGLWNFAMRFAEFTATSSSGSNFGYAYIFDKPDDWVRTASITYDEYGRVPVLDYDDRGSWWLCDAETIYVKYVSNDVSWGMDLGKWPPHYSSYVQYALAMEVCERITSSSSKKEELRRDLVKARLEASNRDAMNEATTKFPPPGRWTGSRFSGRGREGRYRSG